MHWIGKLGLIVVCSRDLVGKDTLCTEMSFQRDCPCVLNLFILDPCAQSMFFVEFEEHPYSV